MCPFRVLFERWVTPDHAEYQENYGAWESDLITTARNTGLDGSQVRSLRDAAIALGQEVGYRGRPAAHDDLVAVFDRLKVPASARAYLVKLWRQIEGGGAAS